MIIRGALLVIAAAVLPALSAAAECPDSLGLPVLWVETAGGEEPSCDIAVAPAGADGISVTSCIFVPGRLYITDWGDTVYDSGRYEDGAGMTIRVRGNSSGAAAKKSFKIKLSRAADILSSSDSLTSRHWLLLSKKTFLPTWAAFRAASLLGQRWTPRARYVNVMMNGDYRGIYILCESVKRSRSRVAVSSSGFIVENDAYWWNADLSFPSVLDSAYRYTFKDPGDDDLSPSGREAITSIVNRAERAMANDTYADVIDTASFAVWLITHDLIGSKDYRGSNIFLYKNDDSETSKLCLGPVWDVSIASVDTFEWSYQHLYLPYFKGNMLISPSGTFLRAYRDRWRQRGLSAVNRLCSMLDSFAVSDEGKGLNRSLPADSARWHTTYTEVNVEARDIKRWLLRRAAWMDSMVSTLPVSDNWVERLGLPVVYIETLGGEEPTCDYVSPPYEGMQVSISNATRVAGRLRVVSDGDTLYDSGDYIKSRSGMSMHIRGNISAYEEKKPWKIKLQRAADLLLRGCDSVYADKDWVLLNSTRNLRPLTGFAVGDIAGMEYIPRFEYVNVVMNGSYLGLYMLGEMISRNPRCRIDIDKDDGYLMEYDFYWWKEDKYWISDLGMEYTFKYPEDDDITEEGETYVERSLNDMEDAINQGLYSEKIDYRSWARWVMVHDILGSFDARGTNIFLTKYDREDSSLWKMPCLWDLDNSENAPDDWSEEHLYLWYFQRLFHNPDTRFLRAFQGQWLLARDTILPYVSSRLDTFLTAHGEGYDRSHAIEAQIYNERFTTCEEESSRLKSWFARRVAWMDSAVCRLPLVSDSVSSQGIAFLSMETADGAGIPPEGTGVDFAISGPHLPYYHSGGYVPGESGAYVTLSQSSVGSYSPHNNYYLSIEQAVDLLGREGKDYHPVTDWVLCSCTGGIASFDPPLTLSPAEESYEDKEHVNFFVDGDYMGVYVLREAMEQDMPGEGLSKDGAGTLRRLPYDIRGIPAVSPARSLQRLKRR